MDPAGRRTREHRYTSFLVVTEPLLTEMAAIPGAEYEVGPFNRATDALHESDEWQAEWEMYGEHGVFIERHEAYLWCTLHADEPYLRRGKLLMWERYLAAGGNPDAASAP